MDMQTLEGIVMATPIPSARGKRATPIVLEYVRDLNEGDLEMILNPPPKGIETSPLMKLRNTHHQLARLMAEGRPQAECSLITGYCPSRISILKNDPAFKELVAYYQTQAEAVYLNVHERLAALGMSTIEELQERLESDPERFTNKELMDLGELLLDRTVAPPKGVKGSSPTSGDTPSQTLVVNFIQAQAKELPQLSRDGEILPITIEGTRVA